MHAEGQHHEQEEVRGGEAQVQHSARASPRTPAQARQDEGVGGDAHDHDEQVRGRQEPGAQEALQILLSVLVNEFQLGRLAGVASAVALRARA